MDTLNYRKSNFSGFSANLAKIDFLGFTESKTDYLIKLSGLKND